MMKLQFRFLEGLIPLFFLPMVLVGQGEIVNDTVYYPELHPVTYDQTVYKTAVRIDEWVPPIQENLSLRVYYPTDLAPDEQRPTVVFIHGGGFIGGSFGSFFDEAEILAQLGFVAVSIQYRLCQRNDCLIAAGLGYPCNVAWGNSLVPSAYVAAVDAADAIRWLQDHAADYHIDPNRMAVGGHSAGAWTSLHMAFMDQEEINEVCSGCGTWPDYLADSIGTVTGIQAVLNMSGAILDTTWIDPEEAVIDVMTIHGTHDGVVYYGTEPVYPCCGTYVEPVEGACSITQRLNHLSGNTYLLTGQDYGHDVFETSWWEINGGQILWFLGKVFFDDQAYQTHVSVQRDNPVQTCPPPLAAIDPALACGLPLSDPKVVLQEEIPVQTQELVPSPTVQVFPNPAQDLLQLTVEFPSCCQPQAYQICLYNSMGMEVLRKTIYTSNNAAMAEQLNISSLSAGVYFVRLQTTQNTFHQERLLLMR
jgi:predicted esterase